MINLYNDLTLKKEGFKSRDKVVRFYSCGPTIYDYVHIGNFRTFAYEDLLVRFLRYKGFKVIHVRNLTDVDDKIINALKKTSLDLKKYTNFYADAFFQDLDKLRLLRSDYYPRATEYIDNIVDFIIDLEKKGYAYKTKDGSIYFDISKFKDYGKLSHMDFSQLKKDASGRTSNDDYDKEDARDFALWKAYDKNDGDVFWDTKIGKGRPGWHIECSVMANTLLGKTLDIHSGGEDLIFPHHENEIAQSEAHNNALFARFWFHPRHLMVDGKKMSKSLNNFFRLRDIEEKGYNILAVKLLYFSSHYKSQLNFTFESLKSMEITLKDINNTIALLSNYFSFTEKELDNEIENNARTYLKNAVKALEDDLNSPKALKELFDFVRFANALISKGQISTKTANSLLKVFKELDKLFGLFKFSDKANKEIIELAKKRFEFREAKNFNDADKLRDQIKEKGFMVYDIPNGFSLIANK